LRRHEGAAVGHALIEGVAFGLMEGRGGRSNPASRRRCPWWAVVHAARWSQLLASTLGVALCVPADGSAAGAPCAAPLAWLANGGGESPVRVGAQVRTRVPARP